MWRDEEKSWHIVAGSLAKPVKLNFYTPYAPVVNVVFEEYLNMMQDLEKAMATAQQRVKSGIFQELIKHLTLFSSPLSSF